MDIVGILEANMDYFSQDVIWITAIRQIGWILVQGLKGICDACENLFNDMYSLLDFTEYPALRDFFDSFQPVIAAIFIVSLLALGIMLTMGHNKGIKIVQNFVIFLAVVTALPVLIQNLNDLALLGKDAIYSNVTAMSDSMIKSNVDDLSYMINNGFNGNEFKVKGNNISEDKISIINVNEVLEPDGIVYDDYEELITTQLDFINEEGQWETKEIKDKWFSIFDPPYYYRYHVDFFLLYVGLISLIIAFIFTAYKTVRIIFEIVTAYLLAIIFSSEISGGRKIVKILDNLKNLYVALLMTVVMIKVFVLANDFINSRDFGTITKTFALLFFTLCLIDGPNIVEKVLGVDIGLSSAWGKMATAVTAARGAGKVASGAAKTARNILFGNPNSPNSKGGLIGRTKDAFGTVTESRPNPNGTDKKSSHDNRASSASSASAFPQNHMNGNGANGTPNVKDTGSTGGLHNAGNMTNRDDGFKTGKDNGMNSPTSDNWGQEVSSTSSSNTSQFNKDGNSIDTENASNLGDKHNNNIHGKTGEVTGYTGNSGDILDNDGVVLHHPNPPISSDTHGNMDDHVSQDMNWRNQNMEFDNQGNLASDIPADMIWSPQNEHMNDVSDGVGTLQGDYRNMSDDIASSPSIGDVSEQSAQSPNMSDTYEQPVQFPSVGDASEQSAEPQNMSDTYGRPVELQSTENSQGRPGEPQNTRSLYDITQPSSKTENVSEGKTQTVDVPGIPEPKYLQDQREYLSGLESKINKIGNKNEKDKKR